MALSPDYTELSQQQIAALQKQIDARRAQDIAAAKGRALAMGIPGSSAEADAIAAANANADQNLTQGTLGIQQGLLDKQFSNDQLTQEEQAAAAQAEAERASQQEISRQEGRNSLMTNGATLAALGIFNKGGAGGGVAANPGAAGTPFLSSGSLFNSTAALPSAGAGLGPSGGGVLAGLHGAAYGQPGGAGLGATTAGIVGGDYLGQTLGKSIYGNQYSNDRAVSRGGKIGAGIGAGLGSYFGPVGSVVGGAVGGPLGANAGKQLEGITGGKAITLGNLASGAASHPLKAIGNAVNAFTGAGAAAKAVKSVFCFLPDTPIEMGMDKSKLIGDLKLGEETLGGFVFSIRRAIADDLYFYQGIHVTGWHAVKENGVWIRIKDSKLAVPIEGQFEIVSIVTSKHRVYSKGVTFADEHEVNEYEYLTIDECLERLNLQEANRG